MEKFCRFRQATDDSMANVHFMLDNQGYQHRLRICNIYFFSSAIIVTRKRLNVTQNKTK
jgi:hypothetical protein